MTQLAPGARVARGVTYIFIQGLGQSLMGIVFFYYLARALADAGHPEEMGVFSLLVFVLALPLTFGTFALPSAATKYISQYMAENNPDKARSVITRVLQISLLSSVIAFLILFLPAESLSRLMFQTADYAEILRIVALASVFNILYMLASSFLQGLQKMREIAIIGLGYTLVQYTVSLYLLSSGWRLYAVVYGWVAGLGVFSIVGLIILSKHLGILGKPHKTGPLFQFSLPLYASSTIGYFISWADQLILVIFMGVLYGAVQAETILGVYYVAIRASAVPALFSTSVVTALFPSLSALYAQKGLSSLSDAFRAATRYAVLVGFPLIAGLMILARPAIILFAGVDYIDAAIPLIIISLGALVGTLSVAAGSIMMTLERTYIVALLSLMSVVLSVVFSIFALAYLGLGMIGTAWARAFASIIGVMVSLYVLRRYIRISIDRESLWKASVASGLMVLTIIALDLIRMSVSSGSQEFLTIRLLLLPPYIAVGAAAYFISILGLKALKRQDIELVEAYLPKSLKRLATWLGHFAVAD